MTTIPTTPPTVISMVLDLADCVCAMVEAEGAGPTCWCGVYPGASVAWDYCGECSGDLCGMAWVRPAAVFPYSTFPIPVTDIHCTQPLAWSVEVGALRCIPVTADGSPLSPEVMTDIAIGQMLDARAMHKAITCCGFTGVAVEIYQPVGPQGGCVGGLWTAYLDVPSY